MLTEEDNDPFRVPPVLREYTDSWDGQVFMDMMESDLPEHIVSFRHALPAVSFRITYR